MDRTPQDAVASVTSFFGPVFGGMRDLRWEPVRNTWEADVRDVDGTHDSGAVGQLARHARGGHGRTRE